MDFASTRERKSRGLEGPEFGSRQGSDLPTLGVSLWSRQPPLPPETQLQLSPPVPLGRLEPLWSASEAFPGVGSNHRLPWIGLCVTRWSAESGHPSHARTMHPLHPAEAPVAAATSPGSWLLPWTRRSSRRIDLSKTCVAQNCEGFIYKLVLVNSAFILGEGG